MINERNSDFRKSIKIVKAWKQACCAVDERFKLKSFHLEQILVRTFAQQPRLEIFDALFGYFRELPALLVSPQIPDRADPSRMIDEYVAALTQSEREAVVEARDGFLIRLEEIEISAEIGSLVSGRSRKRRGAAEAYLFDQGIPLLTESEDLRIQGNVLPRAGGFRPEILDQTGLIDVDRRIRFSVTHGVASDLYKWKVKNDDSSPQPRGEISDHSTSSDPEHTQYKGSHFVECFAVRDGTCIARAKQNVVLK